MDLYQQFVEILARKSPTYIFEIKLITLYMYSFFFMISSNIYHRNYREQGIFSNKNLTIFLFYNDILDFLGNIIAFNMLSSLIIFFLICKFCFDQITGYFMLNI